MGTSTNIAPENQGRRASDSVSESQSTANLRPEVETSKLNFRVTSPVAASSLRSSVEPYDALPALKLDHRKLATDEKLPELLNPAFTRLRVLLENQSPAADQEIIEQQQLVQAYISYLETQATQTRDVQLSGELLSYLLELLELNPAELSQSKNMEADIYRELAMLESPQVTDESIAALFNRVVKQAQKTCREPVRGDQQAGAEPSTSLENNFSSPVATLEADVSLPPVPKTVPRKRSAWVPAQPDSKADYPEQRVMTATLSHELPATLVATPKGVADRVTTSTAPGGDETPVGASGSGTDTRGLTDAERNEKQAAPVIENARQLLTGLEMRNQRIRFILTNFRLHMMKQRLYFA